MKVRYEIFIEVNADGMLGPVKILDTIRETLQWIKQEDDIDVKSVRLAAVYPMAEPDQTAVDLSVPGRLSGSEASNP